jgi:hypothetical protein
MYRNTCILVAALAGIYAIAYTLAPQLTASFYFTNADADTALMGRYFGLALVFMAMVCWLLKDSTSSEVQIAVSTAGIAGSLLGFITSLVFTLNGQMTAFTWGPVLIYLITGVAWFITRNRAIAN